MATSTVSSSRATLVERRDGWERSSRPKALHVFNDFYFCATMDDIGWLILDSAFIYEDPTAGRSKRWKASYSTFGH